MTATIMIANGIIAFLSGFVCHHVQYTHVYLQFPAPTALWPMAISMLQNGWLCLRAMGTGGVLVGGGAGIGVGLAQ